MSVKPHEGSEEYVEVWCNGVLVATIRKDDRMLKEIEREFCKDV